MTDIDNLKAIQMPLGWLIIGGFGAVVLSFMTIATILAKLFPSWATQGTLSPSGEATATLVPQGGRIAELEKSLEEIAARLEAHQHAMCSECEGIRGFVASVLDAEAWE